MPTSFTLSYPAEEFNLPRCVKSGQVFRWRDLGDGSWLGVDGGAWFHVHAPQSPEGPALSGPSTDQQYRIESNESEDCFGSLFQLDKNSKEIAQKVLKRGPELRPYMHSLQGLRITRQSDPY